MTNAQISYRILREQRAERKARAEDVAVTERNAARVQAFYEWACDWNRKQMWDLIDSGRIVDVWAQYGDR